MLIRRSRSFATGVFFAVTALALTLVACTADQATPSAGGGNAGAAGTPGSFSEPVRLSGQGGVLEVRLSAAPM